MIKTAICRALSEALGCPIYDGCVPQGLETPSCVLLPPEYAVRRRFDSGAMLEVSVTICARGLEERLPILLHALACVPSEQGAFRGEKIQTKEVDGVTQVTARYRVQAAFEACDESAPLMAFLELNQEE